MRKLHLFKDESGDAAVFCVIILVMLLVFTAAATDLGSAYAEASKMQTALDAGAIAGAYKLPDAAAAEAEALSVVAKNGIDPESVEVVFGNSNKKITLTAKSDVYTSFLKIVGKDTFGVSRTASAGITTKRGGGVFDYRIFCGSTGYTLNMGGKYSIDGSVHCNGGIKSSPSKGYVSGAMEACTSFYLNPYTATAGAVVFPAEYIAMPDFSQVVADAMPAHFDYYDSNTSYNSAWWKQTWTGSRYISGDVSVSNGVVINGDTYINGNFTANGGSPVCEIHGNLFVNGNITFNNTVNVYGCIFATGNIVIRGGHTTVDPSTPVCIYSSGGDIEMTMAATTTKGIIYAPNGTVKLAGSTLTYYGSIVGNVVTGIPANLVMGEPGEEFTFLPETTVVKLLS